MDDYMNVKGLFLTPMGARMGGGQEGALAPPWKFKNMAPQG